MLEAEKTGAASALTVLGDDGLTDKTDGTLA